MACMLSPRHIRRTCCRLPKLCFSSSVSSPPQQDAELDQYITVATLPAEKMRKFRKLSRVCAVATAGCWTSCFASVGLWQYYEPHLFDGTFAYAATICYGVLPILLGHNLLNSMLLGRLELNLAQRTMRASHLDVFGTRQDKEFLVSECYFPAGKKLCYLPDGKYFVSWRSSTFKEVEVVTKLAGQNEDKKGGRDNRTRGVVFAVLSCFLLPLGIFYNEAKRRYEAEKDEKREAS